MNYCLGCHSLKYARYKKVSEDLEIPLDMFQENLILSKSVHHKNTPENNLLKCQLVYRNKMCVY